MEGKKCRPLSLISSQVYETCREAGAIIFTGWKSIVKLLTSSQNISSQSRVRQNLSAVQHDLADHRIRVRPFDWKIRLTNWFRDGSNLHVQPGKTFVVVS